MPAMSSVMRLDSVVADCLPLVQHLLNKTEIGVVQGGPGKPPGPDEPHANCSRC